QKKLPVFDTGAGSMSGIAHYFRENRFLGGDRVGDTEQVALGLGGRAVRAADGAQLLHFQLGKVFYFEDRKLGLDSNNGKPETGKHSGLLAELAARGGALGVTAFARGGRPGGGLDAARLSADYRKDARRGATLAYRYDSGKTRNESGMNAKRDEQLNLAIDAPLGAARQLRAQAAHSLETGETHSSSLTLRFDGCCWAANIGWQRYLDGEGARKARVLFTLELAGLGRLGSRP
ncbi:MAG: LPS-assembly protein LptD, partial [Gammaproteobacteria bacterium]|nr:LPS-assembly protein LptD [Gammaproteobacteria bacterium]